MRNLRKGRFNNKTEVRFLQGALNLYNDANLVVDGDYGQKTKDAVANFQRTRYLTVDGMAGQQTLQELGFRKTSDSRLVMFEIPFGRIEAAHVLTQNGHKYSVTRFAKEGGYDVVWNGAFFQLSSRKIVQFILQNGNVKHWGMGYKGIAYPEPFTKAEGGNYGDYLGKSYDMQGGAPVLIDRYRKDEKAIYSFINTSENLKAVYYSRTRRCCTAITQQSIILCMSIGNMTLNEVLAELLRHKDIAFAQNNDGGGSQSCALDGGLIISTDGRGIPAAVGLRLKLRR